MMERRAFIGLAAGSRLEPLSEMAGLQPTSPRHRVRARLARPQPCGRGEPHPGAPVADGRSEQFGDIIAELGDESISLIARRRDQQ
jgi:hypothetical protein